jgi:hypothetical protein
MTPESAGFSAQSLPPLIVGAVSFVILIFGATGAYIALRKKGQPDQGTDVPQWFYVRDLVHEVRNLRQVIENMDRNIRTLLDRGDHHRQ